LPGSPCRVIDTLGQEIAFAEPAGPDDAKAAHVDPFGTPLEQRKCLSETSGEGIRIPQLRPGDRQPDYDVCVLTECMSALERRNRLAEVSLASTQTAERGGRRDTTEGLTDMFGDPKSFFDPGSGVHELPQLDERPGQIRP